MTKEQLAYHKKWRDKNRNKINKNARQKRANNCWESKQYHYKKLYGITPQEFIELLKKQNGVCAICFKSCTAKKSLGVDHNHQTGKIRGLLCHNCNIGIGNLKDDIFLLQRAIEYIKKAEEIKLDFEFAKVESSQFLNNTK
jgi:hypothetical protein